MREEKSISTFTEAKVQEDGSCVITATYDDGLSEIHATQIVSVDPKDRQIENNTFPGIAGYGTGTVDRDRVPEELIVEKTLSGNIVMGGANASKYSIDQNTGHLIFTEP